MTWEITKLELSIWLSAYQELLRQEEYWMDKSAAALEEGDQKRAKRYEAREKEYEFKADGMLKALEAFGFTVIRQFDPITREYELRVVEKGE